MVGQGWDLQAESEERVRFIACRKRKVIPRIEGSIRQARNVCGVGTASGGEIVEEETVTEVQAET